MKKQLLCGPVLVLLVLIMACQNVIDSGSAGGAIPGSQRSVSDEFGNTYLLPYSPYSYKVQLAKFAVAESDGTSKVISADRKLNAAVWNTANSASVDTFKNPGGVGPAGTYSTDGTLKSVWDGYTLYLAVEVHDNTPAHLTALQNTTARMTSPGNDSWNNFDAVQFNIDFTNDKLDKGYYCGMVKVSRNGKLAYNRLNGTGDETWADNFGEPTAREFNDRLKDWNAYEVDNGYIVWLAVELYAGADPQNGMDFGFDVAIQDSPADNQSRTGITFWSHNDDTYRVNNMDGNLDWGVIVLTGHTATDNSDFAHSDWMLTNPIRWAKGEGTPSTGWWPPADAQYLINLPDSVADSWTSTTWTVLQNAIAAGKAILTATDDWNRPHVNWSTVTQQEVITKAHAIEAAIMGLRWADDNLGATQYDADPLFTLPDPLKFKTNGDITPTETIPGMAGKKGTIVQNAEDWALRVREIKALAAIYEYGPIPDAPSSHSVVIQSTPAIPAHWEHPGWWIVGGLPSKVDETPSAYSLTATYTYNGSEGATWDGTPDTKISGLAAQSGTKTDSYTISFPTEADKASVGITGGVPVVVSFTGSTQAYLRRGIAVVNVPTSVTTDARSNTVWQTRDGTFRTFYPYNGRGRRYEFSNEMGAAWGASRAIDALYDAMDMDLYDSGIAITNIQSSQDFRLGDRLSTDGVTWWTVGQLNRPETPNDQLGTGGITMLFLGSGAVPPSNDRDSSVGNLTFTLFQTIVGNGVYSDVTRGSATATVTVGTPQPTGKKMRDIVDANHIATDGFSINGKYAFVSQVFDDRIDVGIPGAAGATGPQTWRYNAAGNEYAWGKISGYPSGGAELIADNTLHNPGRANEVFRRFLNLFKWYVPLMGIDANGDISHGFAERLPFDNHELVASLYPRAIIERNTFNDYNDGSEGDAISMQASRIVYRYLIDKGVGDHKTDFGTTASAEDLIKFNYRATGGHGSDPIQAEREAQYMAWYFYGKPVNATFAAHLNTDPFFVDVLVPGGSNSYERHYGGFKVMMPWSWAGPYYPK
jgi:hypothetical protein